MTVTLTVDRVRVSASAAQYVLAISARIMVSRGRGCLSLSIAVCAFGYTHRALTERLRALSLDTTVDTVTPHAARRVGTASIQLYGRTCYYEIRVGLGGYVELVISSLQLPRNGFITILATQLYSSTAGARVPAQQP